MSEGPFIRSVYCMNVEEPWTNSADEASPGIVESDSPIQKDQTVFDNPAQANDLFNIHVSKHHDRFIYKLPIESCYMNVLPSYRVQYYVRDNRNSARIAKDEVAIPEAALGTNEQQSLKVAESRHKENDVQENLDATFVANSVPPLNAQEGTDLAEKSHMGNPWKSSVYAWELHEEVPDTKDTMIYNFEVGQNIHVTPVHAVPLEISNSSEKIEALPLQPFETASYIQNGPAEKFISPMESHYIGIPNDLYLFYLNGAQKVPEVTLQEKDTEKEKAPEIQTVFCAPRQADQQSSDSKHENINPNGFPGPSQFPEVQYATQYSPFGEAFAPVTCSAYQHNELNELASCIDAV
ncbi:hypothetical protein V3C99_012683 [Haemonchus contortus]